MNRVYSNDKRLSCWLRGVASHTDARRGVAAHNGSIGFINFASDTGVATLKLSGACSGCAMSKLTLHQGVERLLKHYVPEVNSIVGEDDEKAAEQGYKPFIPRDERDV